QQRPEHRARAEHAKHDPDFLRRVARGVEVEGGKSLAELLDFFLYLQGRPQGVDARLLVDDDGGRVAAVELGKVADTAEGILDVGNVGDANGTPLVAGDDRLTDILE